MSEKYQKHFLDTSILYPIILGSEIYKDYLKDQFGNNALYISEYVQMEFIRSYICPILDFYFFLDMPHINTINDAMIVWSNKFQIREVKAVLNFVGQLFSARELDLNDFKDKKKALSAIEQIIIRIYSLLKRKFKDIGINSIRCVRCNNELKFKDSFDRKESFRKFLDNFLDSAENQTKCRLNDFFSKRFKVETKKFIKHADNLPNPNRPENKGFVKISKNLNKFLQKDVKASCHFCGIVGDAVITLEVPQNMRLEHTDYSFDHLCEVVDKSHHRHKSQITVVRSLQS